MVKVSICMGPFLGLVITSRLPTPSISYCFTARYRCAATKFPGLQASISVTRQCPVASQVPLVRWWFRSLFVAYILIFISPFLLKPYFLYTVYYTLAEFTIHCRKEKLLQMSRKSAKKVSPFLTDRTENIPSTSTERINLFSSLLHFLHILKKGRGQLYSIRGNRINPANR